ncbi:MAG: hypothetical protein IJA23_02485 [Clostridia bacterium]|nr:hypothetical protein [Clostridia bacterium]
MIFSNKLNKISSGKNISLYALSKNEFEFYTFNSNVKKKKIIYDLPLKCLSTDESFSYNYLCKLENNFMCVCHDDNMSILKNG